jgi:beta-galactosidase
VTDNDRAPHGEALEPLWRDLGLQRMQHRTDEVTLEDSALVVRTRVAPAGTALGLSTTYRWSAPDGESLALTVEVVPEGAWPCPLPRVGLRMWAPSDLSHVTWFGRGPGEAYQDTGRAARLGRFSSAVEDLQTPYVFPQENGNRADVRWAVITDEQGAGLRIEGRPTVDLAVRPWTSEQLDAARHTPDLKPDDRLWINIDAAQQGIGSASCGPGVLPQYRLQARPVTYSVVFRAVVPSS